MLCSAGQPVLIGGTMGTCSYVLTGTQQGMQETFGSTCHGAGRAQSRNKSRKTLSYQEVRGGEGRGFESGSWYLGVTWKGEKHTGAVPSEGLNYFEKSFVFSNISILVRIIAGLIECVQLFRSYID